MSGRLSVVVGAQFGSEGKGAIAAHLSKLENNYYFNEDDERTVRETWVVRVGGPNAGHTVYGSCPGDGPGGVYACDNCDEHGHAWRLRQVPVGAVSNPHARLVIAAGSEVDFEVLLSEIRELDAAGYEVRSRLTVDASATVLTEAHKITEAVHRLSDRIGSTGKGIGAARASRIMRDVGIVGDFDGDFPLLIAHNTGEALQRGLRDRHAHVIIEGTQGYGLGLHTKYYPQVTSGDCRAIDFLAQAGISPWVDGLDSFRVYVVARVRPIRVAGNSGPLVDETTWDELGLPEERTTVTQKIRRVGEWDGDLVRSAVLANGGGGYDDLAGAVDNRVVVALTMADHLIPALAGSVDPVALGDGWMDLISMVDRVEKDAGAPVTLIGTGPTTVIDYEGPR